MKINFDQQLIDVRSKEPFFRMGREQEKLPITLLHICGEALGLVFNNETLSIEEKRKKAKLIDKLFDSERDEKGELDIEQHEISLIIECIGKAYDPAVFGAVEKIFNKGN